MVRSNETAQEVWKKGIVVSGFDSAEWRKDRCGAWISWNKYGDRNSIYGWEIHHIAGGEETEPLQWDNNVATGDGRLTCVVTSSANKNIKKSS